MIIENDIAIIYLHVVHLSVALVDPLNLKDLLSMQVVASKLRWLKSYTGIAKVTVSNLLLFLKSF